jgi:hypothetical protein
MVVTALNKVTKIDKDFHTHRRSGHRPPRNPKWSHDVSPNSEVQIVGHSCNITYFHLVCWLILKLFSTLIHFLSASYVQVVHTKRHTTFKITNCIIREFLKRTMQISDSWSINSSLISTTNNSPLLLKATHYSLPSIWTPHPGHYFLHHTTVAHFSTRANYASQAK